MKFSIIVPAFNSEQTLERCLASIQSQIFSDFEAIIIDDGSMDKTSSIGKDFAQADPRFRYFFQENQGVSAARNHGMNIAQGDYIVFLDSDDQYTPEYLQEFDALIREHPECDHFWCCYKSIDRDGKELGRSVWTDDTVGSVLLDRSNIMSLHEKALDAALWNKAFRKQIISEHQLIMDEDLSLGEDMLFNFAYLDVCKTKIAIRNAPLYIYTRSENGSLDSKFRPNLKEIFENMNCQLLAYLQRWAVSQEQLAKYYSSVIHTTERVLYNTYRSECPLTVAEKRKFNQILLKSNYFQAALIYADCYIHPLFRFAYREKCWNLIMVLNAIVKIKNRFKKE